jgi:hypothetical protein
MWVECARTKYGSRIRISHNLSWLQCVSIHSCRLQLRGALLNHIQLLRLKKVRCAKFMQRRMHLIPIQFRLFQLGFLLYLSWQLRWGGLLLTLSRTLTLNDYRNRIIRWGVIVKVSRTSEMLQVIFVARI